MKALVYLAGIVAIGFAVAWFCFGVHPEVLVNRVVGAFNTTGAEKSGDVTSAAGRLKAVGQDRLGEAQDVYNGKTEKDDPFAAK